MLSNITSGMRVSKLGIVIRYLRVISKLSDLRDYDNDNHEAFKK